MAAWYQNPVRWSYNVALAAAMAATFLCNASRAAEPYDLHVILPLTGPGAFLGTAEQISLKHAETMLANDGGIGGRPIRFVFHDDQSSPQVAVQLATQVAAGKPAAILGSGLVAMCNAMAPLMRRGPVQFCFSPGIYPPAGSFTFSSSAATRDLATVQIRWFRAKGMLRLAVITSTDASGQDAARNIKEILALPENKDIQLVAESTFNPSDVSAAAQIERIKSANPQAIIAWSTGTAVGTVFKAIQDSGMDVPVATTDGNMTYAFMERYAAILPKDLYIPSPEWPMSQRADADKAVEAAKARFFAAFGKDERPDAASTYSWDPAMLVISGLQKLGPDATAEQLRAYLAGLMGFAGVNGIYDFPKHPQRGLDDTNVVVTKWNKATTTWDLVSAPRGAPL